jgi:hypothetical protein
MNTLLFIFRLVGVTIVDEEASSEMALEARDHKIQEGDRMLSELAKAREDGPYCFVINTESGLHSLQAPAWNRKQGEERCSRLLQSS